MYKFSIGQPMTLQALQVLGGIKIQTTLGALTREYMEIFFQEDVSLSVGTGVNLSFTDDEATYSFSSQVVAKGKDTLRITPPKKLGRKKHRRFVRVDINKPAIWSPWSDSSQENEGTVTNISGGGLTVATNVRAEPNSIISISFSLGPELEFLNITSKVFRMSKLDPGLDPATSGYEYEVAIAFTVIDEQERDKIIKYVLQEQMRLKREGRL